MKESLGASVSQKIFPVLLVCISLALQLLLLTGVLVEQKNAANLKQKLHAAVALENILLESCITNGAVGYNFGTHTLKYRAHDVLAKIASDFDSESYRAENLVQSLSTAQDGLKSIAVNIDQSERQRLGDTLVTYLGDKRSFFSTPSGSVETFLPWLAGGSSIGMLLMVMMASRGLVSERERPSNNNVAVSETSPAQLAIEQLSSLVTRNSKFAKSYLDRMPVGLFSVDAEGFIYSANARAISMLRGTIEAAVGKQIHSHIRLVETDKSLSMRDLVSIANEQVVQGFLIRMDDPEQTVPVEISMSEFETPQGRAYLVNLLDISERHEMEQLKKDLLSVVSHDLRTPLTSIAMFLQSLKAEDSGLQADYLGSLNQNQREAERLIRMVCELLDIAKINAGKFEIHKGPFDLNPFIDRLVLSLSRMAQEKQIKIETKVVDDFVIADEDRIYQVLENLVTNAIKFSPQDSIITIQTRTLPEGVRFEVKDCGPGIPEEKHKLIFDRFSQLSREDRTARGGTGFGLAICKLIVEQHGGRIGVDSVPGNGSTFWFVLPD